MLLFIVTWQLKRALLVLVDSVSVHSLVESLDESTHGTAIYNLNFFQEKCI